MNQALYQINRLLPPVATTLSGPKFVANAGLKQFDQFQNLTKSFFNKSVSLFSIAGNSNCASRGDV